MTDLGGGGERRLPQAEAPGYYYYHYYYCYCFYWVVAGPGTGNTAVLTRCRRPGPMPEGKRKEGGQVGNHDVVDEG